jgi:glycosyltransferase involved in cell wall biosynthesis
MGSDRVPSGEVPPRFEQGARLPHPSTPPLNVAAQRLRAGFHPRAPERRKPLKRRGFLLSTPLSGLLSGQNAAQPYTAGRRMGGWGRSDEDSFAPGARWRERWPRTDSILQGDDAGFSNLPRAPASGEAVADLFGWSRHFACERIQNFGIQNNPECRSRAKEARLRVVHVYKGYPPVRGGIEGHVDLLTRLLVRRGVAAEVLCAHPGGVPRAERREEVLVHRCWTPLTLLSTPLPPFLPRALRRSAADIVHLHYPWPPNEVAHVLGGRGRPLVVTIHCEVVRQPRLARLLAPLTQRVLTGASRILVTGSFMRAAPLLDRHRERVEVVPLGVDTDFFRPDPPGRDPVPEIPHPRVLFVGRLRHYKGLPVLARALALLPEVRLVVAGGGPERASFESALRAAGCRDRTLLVGEVDDDRLRRLYQHADAAVLCSTSNAEAFGLTIAEAQSCGVPAVTTEVGTGTSQAVADGVSGRVVPPNDAEALARALRWCLDPGRAPALRGAAREHATAKLCARRMTEAIARIYEEAIRTGNER